MLRKIFLDGHLGREITPYLEFEGDSVAEALKCVSANYPKFRKYLIEADRDGIGFSIQVQGKHIEDIRECLLPYKEGDIVITPVIGGSKSGGAKILTAVAIASLFFIGPGGNPLFNLAAEGIKGKIAFAAGSIATNLAITGLQQIMAPDPSVDDEEPESYLFNGDSRSIEEGDPVPVLYGELRVPGLPVSFNLDNEAASARSRYGTSRGNIWTEDDIAALNNSSLYFGADGDIIDSTNYLGTSGLEASRSQRISVVDVISEGPIYGLVNGPASVFLDNKPIAEVSDSPAMLDDTSATFTLASGSTSVTINDLPVGKNLGSFENKRYLKILPAAIGTTTSLSAGSNRNQFNVTANSSIFDAVFVADFTNTPREEWPVIVLEDSNGESVLFGYIQERISGTQAVVATSTTTIDYTKTYNIKLGLSLEIASYSAPTITLANPSPLVGEFNGSISAQIIERDASTVDNRYKFDQASVNFRVGTLNQEPITGKDSDISTISAVTTSVNDQIRGPGTDSIAVYGNNTQLPSANSYIYEGSDFYGGDTVAKWSQTDKVKIFFNYTAMFDQGPEKIEEGQAAYTLEIDTANDSAGTVFSGNWRPLGPALVHVAKATGPISFQQNIDLSQFRPFTNFRIRVTRLTDDDVGYDAGNGDLNSWSPDDKYTGNTECAITKLVAVISEPLTYPYTSYALTTFSTKDFTSSPSRTYLCRGLKVLVPDNYTTREKATTGVAQYSGTWTGAFKAEKEYTNNPAWVFYDLIVNNRYGLGNWVSESDIDKFALYRIARYCDELVPDGNGGLEPRFTSNVYLTKATDAYKVLKDMATIFRGILYWISGEMLTVADRAGDPIYNFSKANVIDGQFSYEGTGNRTRSNQVIVTWNNPDADYAQEPLIVEDRENIIKTGKIIPETAVAFGVTSEGQALRYGRWKLWTAINQTEIVSFKTSINAAYIIPGDIINVQDASRYPGFAAYSGRISSIGTLSTTQVPLDRQVSLVPGSTYELQVLIQKPGAFLNQDTATIGAVVYNRGDLIPSITTEEAASSLVDDSSDDVQITWSKYTITESRTVTTGSGVTSSLTVGTAFSEAPKAQNIWALVETVPAGEVLGSAKQYKVLSIVEDSKNEYSITAVEHYNAKFDSIDEDFVLSLPDPVFPLIPADEVVPPPINLRIDIANRDNGAFANDATLTWEPPVGYETINGYRLTHTFPGNHPEEFIVPATTLSISGMNVPSGKNTIWVQTINYRNNRSVPVPITFGVGPGYDYSVARLWNTPIGATGTAPINFTSAGVLSFDATNYSFTTKGEPDLTYSFTSGLADTYSQNASGVPSQDFGAMPNDTARKNNSHYVLFDASDSLDPIKLVKYFLDTNLNTWYLYDTGTGGDSVASNFSAGLGTISIAEGSSRVVGVGTSFTSDFAEDSVIKFNSTGGVVTSVVSDTELYLDRTVSSVSSIAYEKPSFTPDKNKDCIFGYIRNDLGTFSFSPMEYSVVPVRTSKSVSLVSDDYSIIYDTSTSPHTIIVSNGTSPPSITVTATPSGFTNPIYRWTVNNVPYTSPEWTTDSSQTAQVPASLDDWSTGLLGSNPVGISVEVAEDRGGTPEVEARDSISVFGINKALDGNDGYTIINSNSSHVFPATPDNNVTDYTNSGTLFEVFKGATELEGITSGTPGPGEFKVTASATNITASSVNGAAQSPGGAIVFADHSAMTAVVAEIIYTIDIEGIATGIQKQTFTLGKEGDPGSITFYQATEPSGQGEREGDLWFDTDDGFKLYRYTGSPPSWTNVQDADIAQAILDATEALGRNLVLIQNTAPSSSGRITGDIWIDDTSYPPYTYSMLYRWDGSAWVAAPTDAVGKVHVDALNSLDKADLAQTTADGKVVTFAQASTPTADGVGDFWVDTDDNNHLYRWNGSQWVNVRDGTIAVAQTAADNAQSTANSALSAANSAQQDADRAVLGLDNFGNVQRPILSSQIATSNGSTTGIVMDINGLRGYVGGVQKLSIPTSGTAVFSGNLSAAGGDFSGDISAASGTFTGDIVTTGQILGQGSFSTPQAGSSAVIGDTSNLFTAGVTGYSASGFGVRGLASGATGVYGSGSTGVGGSFTNTSAANPALIADNTSTGPDLQLQGTGDVSGDANFLDNVLVVGTITSNSNITAFSDMRLKNRIEDLDNKKALDSVNSLDVFYYSPNELCKELLLDYKSIDIGISAQQAKELDLCVTDRIPNTIYDTVDYAKLTPYIIGAMQELSKVVDELKKEIKVLKDEKND